MTKEVDEKRTHNQSNAESPKSSVSSFIHVAGFAGGFLIGFRLLDNLIIGIALGLIGGFMTSVLWALITGKSEDGMKKYDAKKEVISKNESQRRTWKDVE